MIVARTIKELRQFRRQSEGIVGFVPTMGALHKGHLSLVSRSQACTDGTVVSIYVNPTQFNNQNDLQNYPDTFADDVEKLNAMDVDCLFVPTYDMLYPDNYSFQIEETVMSKTLCGEHRPGHFTGVLTVVLKLLNLVQADKAFFGEKDFQQLTLVQGMVNAFFVDTQIIGCPIVREEDGLAMSSRNHNLSAADRARSPRFASILRDAIGDDEAIALLQKAGFAVDYVTSLGGRRFGAVKMGDATKPVRLIDNVVVNESVR